MELFEAAAAKLLPHDMTPAWYARIAAIVLLWIALCLGDTTSLAILGATTFALFFERPPSKGKPEFGGGKQRGTKNELACGFSKMAPRSRPRSVGSIMSGEKNSTENQQVKHPKGYREATRLVPIEELDQAPTEESSLKANMRKLAKFDNDLILSTKRIGKLGVKSDKILTEHFSQFGTVEQVYVCHDLIKGYPDRSKLRVRPGNTGFVVMATASDALAALKAGSEQKVEGVDVVVSRYICRRAELGLDKPSDTSSGPTPSSRLTTPDGEERAS